MNRSTQVGAAAAEWRAHWPVVLAAMAGFSFYSVGSYTTGLFMEPLAKEFGWGRAQISAGLLVTSLLTIPLSPAVGALIDRWGSRRLAVPGMALAIAAIASFGLANGSVSQWLLLWTIYGVVSLAIKATVWTAATSNAFTSGRGLALGFVLCGSALTQTIAPVLAERLIETFGWRQAYLWLALGWGGPVLILIMLFLFEPADRLKGRGVAQRAARTDKADAAGGLGFREAFSSVPLVRIGASTLLFMFLTVGVLIHQVPILTEAGVSRSNAALLASLGGIAGIVGKLVTGWASDRADGGTVGAITLSSTAVAFALLLEPIRSPASIVIAMVIIGYGAGTKLQITAYLTSRYGGLRNFGKIFGVMASLIAVGGGLGPIVAGAVYDHFGSYTYLLLLGIPGTLSCGLLIFRLGPYPRWEEGARPQPQAGQGEPSRERLA
ncbi:MFS transporter [Phenylobacterium sp. LjRoot219]|uniref:MFS transporter n=1 Tax=Phenylobacterium sp. LjRoot219 TaxID=3342283 RepID=UPI003ECCB892